MKVALVFAALTLLSSLPPAVHKFSCPQQALVHAAAY